MPKTRFLVGSRLTGKLPTRCQLVTDLLRGSYEG